MINMGWLLVTVWLALVGLLQLWGCLLITRRRNDLRDDAERLDAYSGQLDDWGREIRIARTNLDNLVTHAERYAEGHEATRAMFTRIVERLHEKLPESESSPEGASRRSLRASEAQSAEEAEDGGD